jgi:hypothetical protein
MLAINHFTTFLMAVRRGRFASKTRKTQTTANSPSLLSYTSLCKKRPKIDV